jgi:hypothetical protein
MGHEHDDVDGITQDKPSWKVRDCWRFGIIESQMFEGQSFRINIVQTIAHD